MFVFYLRYVRITDRERGRNLDPCQIDNFVSSLLGSGSSHQSGLICSMLTDCSALPAPRSALLCQQTQSSHSLSWRTGINPGGWRCRCDWWVTWWSQWMHVMGRREPAISQYLQGLSGLIYGPCTSYQLLCGLLVQLFTSPALQSKYFLFSSLRIKSFLLKEKFFPSLHIHQVGQDFSINRAWRLGGAKHAQVVTN